MGIEEYRFLTNTMEQIADCSGQLESAKKKLPQTEAKIERLRDRVKGITFDLKGKGDEIKKLQRRARRLEDKTSKLPTLKRLNKDLYKAEIHRGLKRKSERESYEKAHRDTFWDGMDTWEDYAWLTYPLGALLALFTGIDTRSDYNPLLFCGFWLIAPGALAYLQAEGKKSRVAKWDEEVIASKKALKEGTAPIKQGISAHQELQSANNRLTKLERWRDDGRKQLEKLEKEEARDENTAATLGDRISSLEEEITALWESIAHLIPYSSALEKA